MSSTDRQNGVFITFEGGEGSGKSTHIRLLSEILRLAGYEAVVLREPGGTSVGEALREIVLDVSHEEIANESELLIYEAARAQIVSECIKPALQKGRVVLCDRFTDSTIAYQVYGRGLSRSFVDDANRFACQGIVPDRTILMRTGGNVCTGLSRATKGTQADRLELAGESFHERVDAGFRELAKNNPERIRVVESCGSKLDTCLDVFEAVSDLFPRIGNVESLIDPDWFSVHRQSCSEK